MHASDSLNFSLNVGRIYAVVLSVLHLSVASDLVFPLHIKHKSKELISFDIRPLSECYAAVFFFIVLVNLQAYAPLNIEESQLKIQFTFFFCMDIRM